jgi:hypothetical protein
MMKATRARYTLEFKPVGQRCHDGRKDLVDPESLVMARYQCADNEKEKHQNEKHNFVTRQKDVDEIAYRSRFAIQISAIDKRERKRARLDLQAILRQSDRFDRRSLRFRSGE